MNNRNKVLISFGARCGGFELVWDLKRRIDERFGGKTAYLDAISLENDSYTHYTWINETGIWKMSNENWFGHYVDALFECKCMIFCITKEWLLSKFCWQEYELFLQSKDITPIFLLSPEAMDILNDSSDQINNEFLFDLTCRIRSNLYIELNIGEPGDYTWEVGNTVYHYVTKYNLSDISTNVIIDSIVNILSN